MMPGSELRNTPIPAPQSSDSTSLFTVLAIDDEIAILKALRRALGDEFVLICKDSVRDAVKLLEVDWPVDAILIDYEMPEANGAEATRLIRHIESRADTPVIMLTGSGSDDIESMAFDVGVTDYVSKQTSYPALAARLRTHCSNYRKKQQLEELAYHDELTGLENRRCLNTWFDREVARCKRSDDFFSLFILDIDHFKSINDNFGHDVGDLALKAIADTLREHFQRPTDHLIRFGGEEFLIAVSGTSPSEIQRQVDLCRDAISNIVLRRGTEVFDHRITASVGGVSLAPDFNMRERRWLFAEADHLLYRAKKRRNCQHWEVLASADQANGSVSSN